jgi:type 1 fimbria pilin
MIRLFCKRSASKPCMLKIIFVIWLWAGASTFAFAATECKYFMPSMNFNTTTLSNPQKFSGDVYMVVSMKKDVSDLTTNVCVITLNKDVDFWGLKANFALSMDDSQAGDCGLNQNVVFPGASDAPGTDADTTRWTVALPFGGSQCNTGFLRLTYTLEGWSNSSIPQPFQVNSKTNPLANLVNLWRFDQTTWDFIYPSALPAAVYLPPPIVCTKTPGSFTVNLGSVNPAKFKKAGDTAGDINFTMNWTGCRKPTFDPKYYPDFAYPDYGLNMTMTYQTPNGAVLTEMANAIAKTDGGAENIVLELIDTSTQQLVTSDKVIALGMPNAEMVNHTFTARFKATDTTITPGKFKSIATYVVNYQ